MTHYDPEQYGYCPYCGGGGGSHKAGCPEYEPEKIGVCADCREPVTVCDDHYLIDRELYHEDCFRDAHLIHGR